MRWKMRAVVVNMLSKNLHSSNHINYLDAHILREFNTNTEVF